MKQFFLSIGLAAAALLPHMLLADEAEVGFDERTGTYLLRVPLADTLDAPGFYQDAVFETATPGDVSNWRLLSVEEGRVQENIDDVKVVVTEGVPAQVFLRVTGLASGCDGVGRVAIATSEKDFSVFIYHPPVAPGVMCLGVISRFTSSVPLPAYGLKAGTYSYSVNGKNNGKFTLRENNVFAEDGECHTFVADKLPLQCVK
ncbi:MAG: hypothetical protein LBF16_12940 [Pseudomonadales bacterium]|jgi:hypothetical protein|nr:hypothetical protein [Pseudomonadales bacterium]